MRIRDTSDLILKRINSRTKELMQDFFVLDKRFIEWFVDQGFITDGSSIPEFIQPIIGDPFEGVTAPASLVHDKYCVTKERSQKDTHRIFRDLVLHEMKVTYKWFTWPWKSKTWQYPRAWSMWAGVRAFNKLKHPKWK